jgi:glutamate N-acetyltransferase/amino-acid N-acetyltransferase
MLHQESEKAKHLNRLPMNNIIQNIPKLYQGMGKSHEHWVEAAKGISTTDTFPKLASRTFTLPSSPNTTFAIAGITKGAGMIHPNMATTIGIICTDAPVTPIALQQLLSTAADKSYNCISIEGDTSTNDMVGMLANGAAGGTEIGFDPSAASQSDDFVALQWTLIEFMADMAKLVVRDGEGASKFITIRVRSAPSYASGKHIASVIARSVLVKTGSNPNWVSVLAALGYSLIDTEFAGKGIIVPELTSISFVSADGSPVLKFLDKGSPAKVDEARARQLMEQEDIEVVVNLRDVGKATKHDIDEAVYWTCDLTHEFVTINGDFRT